MSSPLKLRDKAYDSFTERLLSREIKPGQFVSQRELVEITNMPLGAIRELIPRSVRGLGGACYSPAQIESAIRHVFGPDTQLIDDGTYFVVTDATGLVGCGGWSRRRTLHGGDPMKSSEDPALDPTTEPARIRAFFVAPERARRRRCNLA